MRDTFKINLINYALYLRMLIYFRPIYTVDYANLYFKDLKTNKIDKGSVVEGYQHKTYY